MMTNLENSKEPWTVYRTLIDLKGLNPSCDEVLVAKQELLNHPLVIQLLEELQNWSNVVVNSHKSADQLYHKFAFLADLGLTKTEPQIDEIAQKMMLQRSEEGLFKLPMSIPVHFGGTGLKEWAWAMCDAPLQHYALAKMGYSESYDLETGLKFFLTLERENGWPCAVSKELGKFRGPGRKEDPCPYVNLIMLKLLSNFPAFKESDETNIAIDCLLNLWENSMNRHPYMFYMGSDFRKLKAPFIWYDILNVVDTLSQYKRAIHDVRFKEMLSIIESKADENGFYTPESEWKAWKGWDFGQKKQPSSWLTFLVARIQKRISESEGMR